MAESADVLAILMAHGVKNLESLIQFAAERYKRSAQPIDLTQLPKSRRARAGREWRPIIPVSIGGVIYDPKDLGRFENDPMLFVYAPSQAKHKLIGFVGPYTVDLIHSHLQRGVVASLLAAAAGGGGNITPSGYEAGDPNADNPRGSPVGEPAGLPSTTEVPSPSGLAQFFTDDQFRGDWLWLSSWHAWPDLTEVGRGFLHVNDWNDVISSLKIDGATVELFTDINFGGPSILVRNAAIPNLSDIGWNDRVSSIKNWGV
jgi:hypothetical protein